MNVLKKNKRVDDAEARRTSKIDVGFCVHDGKKCTHGRKCYIDLVTSEGEQLVMFSCDRLPKDKKSCSQF